jgi:hypothetical protein
MKTARASFIHLDTRTMTSAVNGPPESGPTGQHPVPRQAGNDRNASQAGLRRDRGPGKGCAGAMPTESDASVAPPVLARQGLWRAAAASATFNGAV